VAIVSLVRGDEDRPHGIRSEETMLSPLKRWITGRGLTAAQRPLTPAHDAAAAVDDASTRGGWHESSFDLQVGLDVSEREWDDTLPAFHRAT
jgi:hypothetical protein